MQRLSILLLVLVLAAGGAYYFKGDVMREYYRRYAPPWAQPEAGALPGEQAPEAPRMPPEPPQRFSRLPPPAPTGEKQFAPPGTYYLLKRKKITTRDGVKAANPGEQVKLLEKLRDGKLRVTIENADFVVGSTEVTTDVDIAREAERQYLNAPPGEL